MKHSILASACCLVALAAASIASAQAAGWTHQAPKPTPFGMKDVQMLSASEAFAVGYEFLGDSAVVLHTTDGGQTWDPSYPATNDLEGIFFLDAQRGWAVGNGFFHTLDGGATWIKDSQQGSIYDVTFVDALHGFACGNGGYTYRSTNGGLTWQSSTLPNITTLTSVFFHDAQRGWTLNINGELWKTTDGGVSWSLHWDAGAYLHTIEFFNDLDGWAIGGDSFFQTSDGGATWQQRSVPTGTWVYGISFSDPQHGWGVGPGSVRTTDGGATWLPMPDATSYQDLTAVDFIDDKHGILVGGAGIIETSTDGGLVWSSAMSGGTGFTHGLDAIDGMHAWAANDGGEVLRTTNGGAVWERSYVTGFDSFGEMNDVDFLDTGLGWAVGTANAFSGNTAKVVRSDDGGVTWQVQYTEAGAYMAAVEVVDAQTVYALGWVPGPFGAGGFLLRTTNGGQSWVRLDTVAFQEDVEFVDANTGWTVGGAVLKTTDGGQTWTPQFDVGGSCCYVEGVSFADPLNGWFSGWDGIYHTTDGGTTWTPQVATGAPYFQPLKEIQAVSATEAWVVGQDGYVAHTTDAGATWVQETFTTGFQYGFEACYFFENGDGWVGGANVFPQGGIYLRDGATTSVCQTDLGEPGHGLLRITMCGDPLATGGVSTLQATSTPLTAGQPLFIGLSTQNNSTYVELLKWSLIPWPLEAILMGTLDGVGSYSLDVPGGFGPLTIYVQAVAISPYDFSGHATSNALQVELLP